MRQRLIGAAVLVPVVVVVFLAGDPWLTFALVALAAVAAYEASDLVRRAGLECQTWFAVAFAALAPIGLRMVVPVNFFDPRPDHLISLAIGFVLTVVIGSAILGLRRQDPRAGFRLWAGTAFATLYASMLASVIGIWVLGPPIAEGALLEGRLDAPRSWLLILVLTIWALDSFAYVAGRYHGRGRFMNHISPNKTWSGVVGGTAAALLVCTLLVWATGQQPLVGIALGLLIAVAAQAGDLAESMLKRAAGVKDSAALIPGHGGVLDRVDSFLFAGPALLIALVVLPLWPVS